MSTDTGRELTGTGLYRIPPKGPISHQEGGISFVGGNPGPGMMLVGAVSKGDVSSASLFSDQVSRSGTGRSMVGVA
jgi:hypothetical protein